MFSAIVFSTDKDQVSLCYINHAHITFRHTTHHATTWITSLSWQSVS